MSLKLYNSLSSKKEVFKSISDKKVKTYGCGPTVYNDPHIGNFRTFVLWFIKQSSSVEWLWDGNCS